MTIYLPELGPDCFDFPSPFEALQDPNGLLAFGGDLNPKRILNAYRHGVFPWFGPNEPLLWWSPAPRAVFVPTQFTPSRSLKKFQKKAQYRITINAATEQVINYCSSTRPAEETWLNQDMRRAYIALSKQGHCHSVEVWDEDTLVGGLYGLSIGTLFCGESMFSLKTNASKIALWYFCQHFMRHGGTLIDCQVMNPHLESLGAIELTRETFIENLHQRREVAMDKGCYHRQEIKVSHSTTSIKREEASK
ncbi:leucyl/phenylalanyl-tRNA--protein transferase [Vibrio sp. 10N.286.49.C2]|uniref:leucyl/phenylalanyl-tRNA--protein transferase n=1 Tax=unclassified Vibrio TaxID=2614977 RepID=UPI000C82A890|nr:MULTISPECIES: leucyl/phenylalanyl-tRNA--protein transferase [unclassified Vibrio]PMH37746.1 leucyl/phenylalanyl-tRNA--protein transferase [Vibrio sp. 10N.286.49.C2]PMH45089.1 leucyl/phenylalanyl-tRNA--protein transferase [Vibrio sp. 10N.286.49.B1]PMH77932.1 leucyl/phenylalanyl-tRNA--protein transferase [Vibrio sp. 10N.286.48.B7]